MIKKRMKDCETTYETKTLQKLSELLLYKQQSKSMQSEINLNVQLMNEKGTSITTTNPYDLM